MGSPHLADAHKLTEIAITLRLAPKTAAPAPPAAAGGAGGAAAPAGGAGRKRKAP